MSTVTVLDNDAFVTLEPIQAAEDPVRDFLEGAAVAIGILMLFGC